MLKTTLLNWESLKLACPLKKNQQKDFFMKDMWNTHTFLKFVLKQTIFNTQIFSIY